MSDLCASVWRVLTDLRDSGALWTLRDDDGLRRVSFPEADAAGRFARILGRVEQRELAPVRLAGDELVRWLESLSFGDAEVTLEPEYVAGEGIVGTQVRASALRSVLSRAPART